VIASHRLAKRPFTLASRIILRLLIAGAASYFAMAQSLRAASLQRLTDGRVIVTAFGERLAFREKDAERIDFFWENYPCDPRNSVGSTLARWLNDPKVGECLNRTIPDKFTNINRSFSFTIIPIQEDGFVYPGGVNATEISQTSLVTRSVKAILRGPTHIGFRDDPTVPTTPAQFGYEHYSQGISPEVDRYILKAPDRLNNAVRPLHISCVEINIETCSVDLDSSDRTAALTLEWSQGNFIDPKSDWIKYDAAARKMAQSIFIDRPAGDFQ
jgi:hypothetical protein